MEQFSNDSARHRHMTEELGEKANLTDEDEVAERGRIRDRYHCRLASRIGDILFEVIHRVVVECLGAPEEGLCLPLGV